MEACPPGILGVFGAETRSDIAIRPALGTDPGAVRPAQKLHGRPSDDVLTHRLADVQHLRRADGKGVVLYEGGGDGDSRGGIHHWVVLLVQL